MKSKYFSEHFELQVDLVFAEITNKNLSDYVINQNQKWKLKQ